MLRALTFSGLVLAALSPLATLADDLSGDVYEVPEVPQAARVGTYRLNDGGLVIESGDGGDNKAFNKWVVPKSEFEKLDVSNIPADADADTYLRGLMNALQAQDFFTMYYKLQEGEHVLVGGGSLRFLSFDNVANKIQIEFIYHLKPVNGQWEEVTPTSGFKYVLKVGP